MIAVNEDTKSEYLEWVSMYEVGPVETRLRACFEGSVALAICGRAPGPLCLVPGLFGSGRERRLIRLPKDIGM